MVRVKNDVYLVVERSLKETAPSAAASAAPPCGDTPTCDKRKKAAASAEPAPPCGDTPTCDKRKKAAAAKTSAPPCGDTSTCDKRKTAGSCDPEAPGEEPSGNKRAKLDKSSTTITAASAATGTSSEVNVGASTSKASGATSTPGAAAVKRTTVKAASQSQKKLGEKPERQPIEIENSKSLADIFVQIGMPAKLKLCYDWKQPLGNQQNMQAANSLPLNALADVATAMLADLLSKKRSSTAEKSKTATRKKAANCTKGVQCSLLKPESRTKVRVSDFYI